MAFEIICSLRSKKNVMKRTAKIPTNKDPTKDNTLVKSADTCCKFTILWRFSRKISSNVIPSANNPKLYSICSTQIKDFRRFWLKMVTSISAKIAAWALTRGTTILKNTEKTVIITNSAIKLESVRGTLNLLKWMRSISRTIGDPIIESTIAIAKQTRIVEKNHAKNRNIAIPDARVITCQGFILFNQSNGKDNNPMNIGGF